jgi:hypothetical protein
VRRAFVALTGLAAVALAGCGDGGGGTSTTTTENADQQIRAVVTELNGALRAHDGKRVCEQIYAKRLVARLEQSGIACTEAIDRAKTVPTYDVEHVGLHGSVAHVDVRAHNAGPEAQVIVIGREGGEWRITDAGE